MCTQQEQVLGTPVYLTYAFTSKQPAALLNNRYKMASAHIVIT